MSNTKYEQEVVINFNADEKTASVYSSNPVGIRKMERIKLENPNKVKLINQGSDGVSYEVPKAGIRISPTREMSEEQKEKARERFDKIRKEHPEKFASKKQK